MEQEIYIISGTEDNVREPDISIIKDRIMQGLTCNIKNEWKTVSLKWYDNIDTPQYDFLFICGYIPVCNEKVYKIIVNLKSLNKVHFLPFFIGENKYYIISVLQIEENILNRKKSKIEYYSDKSIMKIERFVLNKFIPQSSLFKIKESVTTFFATKEFVDCVRLNNFTGITSQRCKVIAPLFFNKLFNL